MKKLVCFLILSFVLNNNYAFGFENEKTHPSLTNRAINASVVDDFLKIQLGMGSGLSTELYWYFPSDIEKRIKAGNANSSMKTRTALEWGKLAKQLFFYSLAAIA